MTTTDHQPIDLEYLADRNWWSRVTIKGPDECWPWSGRFRKPATDGRYGQTWDGTRKHWAHRVAFALFHGRQIAYGMTVDHSCFNPPCCNPAHLSEVTRPTNCGRTRPSLKTHCVRGHEFTAENTRLSEERSDGKRRWGQARRCRECERYRQTVAYKKERANR